jgi:hypothetical protein
MQRRTHALAARPRVASCQEAWTPWLRRDARVSSVQPRADARARAARVLVFAATLAGVGLGVRAWRGLSATPALTAHVGLGFAVAALAALQVTAVAARPKPSAPRRHARPPPRPRMRGRPAAERMAQALARHGAPCAVPGGRGRFPARLRCSQSRPRRQGPRCRALPLELT